MCRDYKGFGIALVSTGAFFLFLTLLTTMNAVKIAVVAFFLLLGAADLVLYHFFGER